MVDAPGSFSILHDPGSAYKYTLSLVCFHSGSSETGGLNGYAFQYTLFVKRVNSTHRHSRILFIWLRLYFAHVVGIIEPIKIALLVRKFETLLGFVFVAGCIVFEVN